MDDSETYLCIDAMKSSKPLLL